MWGIQDLEKWQQARMEPRSRNRRKGHRAILILGKNYIDGVIEVTHFVRATRETKSMRNRASEELGKRNVRIRYDHASEELGKRNVRIRYDHIEPCENPASEELEKRSIKYNK